MLVSPWTCTLVSLERSRFETGKLARRCSHLPEDLRGIISNALALTESIARLFPNFFSPTLGQLNLSNG